MSVVPAGERANDVLSETPKMVPATKAEYFGGLPDTNSYRVPTHLWLTERGIGHTASSGRGARPHCMGKGCGSGLRVRYDGRIESKPEEAVGRAHRRSAEGREWRHCTRCSANRELRFTGHTAFSCHDRRTLPGRRPFALMSDRGRLDEITVPYSLRAATSDALGG